MSKGENTRQRIVETAAPLFNQRGFSGCSMQDVMESTGLQKGGLYRHFASKEELAAEAFRHSLAQATKLRLEHIDASLSAPERLKEAIRHFVEKPSPVPGGCPILNTAVDADDGNPVLRKLVREGLAAWKDRIEGVVREGIAAGQMRGDTSPSGLANAVVAMLEGAVMISRLEGSKTALQDAQASLQVLIDNHAAVHP